MKNILQKIVILFFLIILSPQAFAYLHADGQNIVDSTGASVLLKGYGLGGWLVPEGYMLHTPGFGSPRDIYEKIEGLIGTENTEQFFEEYRANYVTEEDIELIAEWGFNSIRLPFHYVNFYDTTTQQIDEYGFNLVDTLLVWCKLNGLYLILDMHCAPGGQSKDNISDSDGIEARFWTEPENQNLAIFIWKEIALRYANEPQIGGYDLLNETVLPDGYSATHLRNFFVACTDTIRTVDNNHIVFIEGNWYATSFDELTPPFDDNMSYSFHKYWNATDIGTIQYLLSIRSQYNVPLWLGETGENSNPWFFRVKNLMENNNIGWCWWAHKKLETITSPLSSPIDFGFQILLDYWNGQGSQPSESYAIAALHQMTENLRIENCDFRPGVIKSLMDPDFGNVSTPFKE
ncbi:MAG: glycoside hydrolase family 5 protein, partial [Calditrichia bacterium]|nr:glycoside hydrolase family 5 protein [Calditrichia bacterium]